MRKKKKVRRMRMRKKRKTEKKKSPRFKFKSKLAAFCSPVRTPHSTIDARRLNFRVRHGAGCIPAATATNNFFSLSFLQTSNKHNHEKEKKFLKFSIGQLNASQHLHFRPILLFVLQFSYSLR